MEVSLQVQGREMVLKALIDSGASANFLNKSICDSLFIETNSIAKLLILADGSSSKAEKELQDVEIVLLGTDGTISETKNDFLIMNLQYDCILGLPWMQA